MHRIFFTTVLIFCFIMACTGQAIAQRKKQKPVDETAVNKKNIVSTFPFSFVGGSILLGYERNYAPKKSVKILAGIGAADRSRYYSNDDNSSGAFNVSNHVDNMSSFYLELQPRFYIVENFVPMNGLYMAPVVLYKQMNFDLTVEQNDFISGSAGQNTVITLEGKQASAYSIGYIIGYQAVFRSTLSLDFYLGGGMMRANGDHKMISPLMGVDQYRNGIAIHLGAAIGMAF